jgi:hypothetical protein
MPTHEPPREAGSILDPLSQSLADDDTALRASPVRPATYYGDADHPTSEDEDEALLEKPESPTPGMIERGGLDAEATKVRPVM